MILTSRDMDLMTTLLEVKILTIDQITRLFFSSPSACRNRLLLLRRNGWLQEDRPISRHSPSFSVLKLGKKAFRYFECFYPKNAPTVYLEHRLGLNDLYVELQRTGVLKELNLEWQDGSNFEISFRDTHFNPDARMIGKSKSMIYLEYDRGTKNLPVIQENLSRYVSWFNENEFQATRNWKIKLIYITPKNSRAIAIQKQFEIASLKQNRSSIGKFEFQSMTTQSFLEQSKSILTINKGQLWLVNGNLRQTNQITF